MKKINHVIVGTDYSEASDNAIREARRIADWEGATLTLTHVVDEASLEHLQRERQMDVGDLINGAQHRLDKTKNDLLGEDDRAKTVILVGHPFAELFRASRDWGADLLVLGSRGYGKDKPGRVGVVAAKCIRKAPLPVLLVRPRQHEPFRKVAACVDFSDNARLAVEHALHIARQDNATLDLVHVDPTSHFIMTGYGSFMLASTPVGIAGHQAAMGEALKEFADSFESLSEGVEVNCHVIDAGHVPSALCSYLKESQTDLAVVGTRGRTGANIILLGTTAEALIHDAPCSVLAIKPEDFSFDID